jgi:hypothetical protein
VAVDQAPLRRWQQIQASDMVLETPACELVDSFSDVLGAAHALGKDDEAPHCDLNEILVTPRVIESLIKSLKL